MDTYLVEIDEQTGEVTGGVIGLRGLEDYNLGDLFRLAKDGAMVHAEKTSWEIFKDGYSFVVTKKNGKINIGLKDITWNGTHGPTGRVDARKFLEDVFGMDGNQVDADGDGVKKNATDGVKDFVDNAFDFVFGTGD